MIGDESALKTNYDDVAVLIHMDGEGGTPSKIATWNAVMHAAPKGVPFGWKNFYKEDHPTHDARADHGAKADALS